MKWWNIKNDNRFILANEALDVIKCYTLSCWDDLCITELLFEGIGTTRAFLDCLSKLIAAKACWTASCLTSEWYLFSLCVYLNHEILIINEFLFLLHIIKKFNSLGVTLMDPYWHITFCVYFLIWPSLAYVLVLLHLHYYFPVAPGFLDVVHCLMLIFEHSQPTEFPPIH